MTQTPQLQDLSSWIAHIRGREMPVFARTVEALRRIIGDERASASALAQIILKDVSMTAKVLRLANSAFFNHSHQGVSTVSRAIVVLGFNPVAELALSVSLIDSLLGGGVRSRIQVEMARSFHAAVQARWASRRHGDPQGEEVFIAALLTRVGEMAFWCFGGEQARALDRCMSQQVRMREEEAQQVVLGFPLRHLSVGLVREWKLGALATAALDAEAEYDLFARIKQLAEGAPTAFMPQCGLAPGFIGIVAHHLAQGFDTLHEVKMRVGALPAFPTNALKYNLTWSVDGLINEYCHPCEAIRGGRNIEVLPLEGLEHFSLDGTEYEAFNTSGGLGTLCETWAGKVRNLDYKTVRYPGHRDLMQFLLGDLGLKGDQENLKAIMRKSMPATMQDVVLVFVTVSGMKNGVLLQEVFARKIFATRDGAQPLSAIQITTAAGICAAVDLFREGKLPQQGFVRQEQVALPDFLANRFGSAYQQSRQVESIS